MQGAAALLMHGCDGRPLLPVAPKHMAVLVQMPAPEGYFGNGSRLLRVSLPAGTAQPGPGGATAALRALAGAIRRATAAFRANPEEPLAAMADTEALAAAPALRMLAFLATTRLPHLSCSVNYVPAQPKVRGHWGSGAALPRGAAVLGRRRWALCSRRAAACPIPTPTLVSHWSLPPLPPGRWTWAWALLQFTTESSLIHWPEAWW